MLDFLGEGRTGVEMPAAMCEQIQESGDAHKKKERDRMRKLQ